MLACVPKTVSMGSSCVYFSHVGPEKLLSANLAITGFLFILEK